MQRLEDCTIQVISTFKQRAINDDGDSVLCEGWTFTCKAEIYNLIAVLNCQNRRGLSVAIDTTYKVLQNGWSVSTIIAETIVSSEGGIYYIIFNHFLIFYI